LLRGFNLEDEDARWEAAQTLTKLAQTHPPLAARLKTLSRSGSPLERRMALCCLRDLPRSVHNRPEAFLSALDDPDPIVRSAAVTTLGRMGPRTPHVLDGLLAKLKADPSILIRRVAAVALGQIAAGRRDVRSSLEESMEADDPDLRRAARHALARLSPVPERRRRSALRSRRSAAERRGRKRK
jgi:HEAT repeat protein